MSCRTLLSSVFNARHVRDRAGTQTATCLLSPRDETAIIMSITWKFHPFVQFLEFGLILRVPLIVESCFESCREGTIVCHFENINLSTGKCVTYVYKYLHLICHFWGSFFRSIVDTSNNFFYLSWDVINTYFVPMAIKMSLKNCIRNLIDTVHDFEPSIM